MSESLLNLQEIALNSSLTALVLWIMFLVISLIISLIIIYFNDKKDKLEKERSKLLQEKLDSTQEILSKGKVPDMADELEKTEKEYEEKRERINKDIEKQDRKIAFVENFKVIKIMACVMAFVFIFITFVAYGDIGGSFGDIHAVEYENQGVNITAYYSIRYEQSDQRTLSVFVENNSGKSIQSVVVKQKGTNNKSTLYNVDPGQEKIVTIDSYRSDNYEFEIVDIQFVE